MEGKVVILRIKNSSSNLLDNEKEITSEAYNFFASLFSQEEGCKVSSLECIPKLLTEEDADFLGEFPTIEEVRLVFFFLWMGKVLLDRIASRVNSYYFLGHNC